MLLEVLPSTPRKLCGIELPSHLWAKFLIDGSVAKVDHVRRRIDQHKFGVIFFQHAESFWVV